MCALKNSPNDSFILALYGDFLFEHGHPDVAYEFYKVALQFNPSNAALLNNLACVSMVLGKYEQTEEYFQQSLNYDPNNFTTLDNYVRFLRDVMKNNMKVSQYMELLERNENKRPTLLTSQIPIAYVTTRLDKFKEIQQLLKLNIRRATVPWPEE